jgi:hypothetical protein
VNDRKLTKDKIKEQLKFKVMVKVKIFEDICNCKDMENKINAFLVDNDVEFVDIKYSTSFNHCSVFSALLIYKEK